MSVTIEEFQSFRRFADDKLRTVGVDSLENLVALWRAEQPKPSNQTALQAANAADPAIAAKRNAVPYL